MNRTQRLAGQDRGIGVSAFRVFAGATVLRRMDIGGVEFKRGSTLSEEIVNAIPHRTLVAMAENGYLELH